MLFTPKQRGKDWYWFNKMWLYMFSFLSGVAAIVGMLSFEVAFSENFWGCDVHVGCADLLETGAILLDDGNQDGRGRPSQLTARNPSKQPNGCSGDIRETEFRTSGSSGAC